MALPDAGNIVAAVVCPVVFFSALFGLAICYRRSRWGQGLRHPGYRTEKADMEAGPCPTCAGHSQNVNPTSRPGGLEVALPQEVTEAKMNFAEPHFLAQPVTVRRISLNPHENDIVQRVNSISSSLLPAYPSSEVLPFGGRKSSIGSAWAYKDIRSTDAGGVAVGESRPSALSDPNDGVLSVRRVSADGSEDVVRVRSASQTSLARRESSLSRIDFSEPTETLPTPPLGSGHPFAGGSMHRATRLKTAEPFVLALPPRSPRGKGKGKAAPVRPDSVQLAKRKAPPPPTDTDPIPAIVRAGTVSSTTAVKSPVSPASASSGRSRFSPFKSWGGFSVTSPNNAQDPGQVHLSPKSPIDPPRIHPPASPPPLPTFAINAPEATSPVENENALAVTVDESSPRMRPSSVALTDEAGPGSPTGSKRASRITYLSDLVKENEERRRSGLSVDEYSWSASPVERPRSRLSYIFGGGSRG